MLLELYMDGYFDYQKYLLNNAVKLELTPNEIIVLLYLLDEYKKGSNSISLAKIEEHCLIHRNEITTALSNLLEHSLYKVYMQQEKGIGVEKFSVEPFFQKIEQNYVEQNKPEEDEINKIIKYVEKKANKILTAADYDAILMLVSEEHYSYQDFVDTVNHIEKSKYDVTIRNIQRFIAKNDNPVILDESLQNFMKKIGLKR